MSILADQSILVDLEPIHPKGPFKQHDIDFLRKVYTVLHDLGIVTWIDSGTLLGLYRDGAFIPWDNDIDLSVWDSQFAPQVEKVKSQLESADIIVRVAPNRVQVSQSPDYLPINIGRYYHEDNKAIRRFRRPDPKRSHYEMAFWAVATAGKNLVQGPIGRLISRGEKKHDNRSPSRMYKFLNKGAKKIRNAADAIENALMPWLPDRYEMVVDSEHFEKFRLFVIDDIKLLAPHDVERYLSFKYGSNWDTPVKSWQYWKDDGSVRESP